LKITRRSALLSTTAALGVAQHCGNYKKSGIEQRRINDAIISEIVLPGLV
jgi:hypothetical protein